MSDAIVAILHKRINGTALNFDEQLFLDQWLARSPHFIQLLEEIKDPALLEPELRKMLSYDTTKEWAKLHTRVSKKNRVVLFFRHHPFRYAAAAAALLVLLSPLIYLAFSNHFHTQSRVFSTNQVTQNVHDIGPATDKAILTSSTGKQIVLDNAAAGSIFNEGNVNIIKDKNGNIECQAVGKNTTNDKVVYHTFSIPRGGRPLSIQLADSSLVLVNAASSVTFPIPFSGNERKLSLTGEAYFEVAKNPKKPFRVESGRAVVEVLGTHFNINSYNDDGKMKVTLLEGKVKVTNTRIQNTEYRILQPGEQAQIEEDKNIVVTKDIDLEQIMSWKNGVFVFRKANMQDIMKEVSRYYDADVVFADKITDHYEATGISRAVSVSKLLDIFEKTGGVYFNIEGKNITVKSGRRP